MDYELPLVMDVAAFIITCRCDQRKRIRNLHNRLAN